MPSAISQSSITTKFQGSVIGDHNHFAQTDNSKNIYIISFDNFIPDKLSPEEFDKLMKAKGPIDTILACIENQQFNEDSPQNMNVFVSNLKDKIARVFDGYKWCARDGEEVIEGVLGKYRTMIDDVITDVEDNEDQEIFLKIAKVAEKWNKQVDRDGFDENAKKDILFALYNLRDVVKKVHKVGQR